MRYTICLSITFPKNIRKTEIASWWNRIITLYDVNVIRKLLIYVISKILTKYGQNYINLCIFFYCNIVLIARNIGQNFQIIFAIIWNIKDILCSVIFKFGLHTFICISDCLLYINYICISDIFYNSWIRILIYIIPFQIYLLFCYFIYNFIYKFLFIMYVIFVSLSYIRTSFSHNMRKNNIIF